MANRYVDTTSTQNIGGVKTFSNEVTITGPAGATRTKMLTLNKLGGYGGTIFYQTYNNDHYTTGKTFEVDVTGKILLQLATNNSGSAAKILFPFGNVGIGTASPTEKLEVSGNIKATSFLGKATSAGNADTANGQKFNWSNSSNSPTYLWGANANGTAFLASRADISVKYATSAGSAGSSTTAAHLPTAYVGGAKLNPQTYFNNTVGLKVAMTGVAGS